MELRLTGKTPFISAIKSLKIQFKWKNLDVLFPVIANQTLKNEINDQNTRVIRVKAVKTKACTIHRNLGLRMLSL
ncbi:hypothetical protein [Paenibacillus sp. LjRoot56]|uniref:hypothetical protein n=1 Tax=Paenibacillus sp. LjRoot56 TaxID=3342333 RepID=UPI003ED02522